MRMGRRTAMPSSSFSSRRRQDSQRSPLCRLPPGNSQNPLKCAPALRRQIRIFPSRSTIPIATGTTEDRLRVGMRARYQSPAPPSRNADSSALAKTCLEFTYRSADFATLDSKLIGSQNPNSRLANSKQVLATVNSCVPDVGDCLLSLRLLQ